MKKKIAKFLNKIPEVYWDRYVKQKLDYIFYGWINRKDKYKDFIVLYLVNKNQNIKFNGFITSSTKLSKKIVKRLGLPISNHSDCIRVESMFPNNEVNAIKL